MSDTNSLTIHLLFRELWWLEPSVWLGKVWERTVMFQTRLLLAGRELELGKVLLSGEGTVYHVRAW